MGEQTAGPARPVATGARAGTPRRRRPVPGRHDLPVLLLGTAVVAALTLSTTALGDPWRPSGSSGCRRPRRRRPPRRRNGATAGTLARPGPRRRGPRRPRRAPRPAGGLEHDTLLGALPSAPFVVRSTAPGKGRTVALTFDDGPSPYTTKVLGALAREHVHATFFVIGQQVRARAATLAQVVRAGHLVGDHSWDHSHPSSVPGGWSRPTSAGRWPTTRRWRRRRAACPAGSGPPGGFLPRSVLPAARAQRMGVVLWSRRHPGLGRRVDLAPTAARRTAMTRAIVHAALAGLSQRHPIVLLHDGGGYRGATVQAIPEIIARSAQPGTGSCASTAGGRRVSPDAAYVQARRGVPRTCRNRSHCRCGSAR